MTNERLGGVAAATSREFTSGQKVFGCYDIRLFLDERGFDWKLSDFSSSAFAPHAHELHWLFSERDSVDTGTSGGPRLNFDYNLGANSFAAATASSAFDAA